MAALVLSTLTSPAVAKNSPVANSSPAASDVTSPSSAAVAIASPTSGAAQYSAITCTLGESGYDVQVSFAGDSTSCASRGQQLSAGLGGFWQLQVFDESLRLTCAMENGSVVAYVMDTGGMVFGRSLCEHLQSNGWVEDLAAEQDVVGAQASASAAAAAVAATASAAASFAAAVNNAQTAVAEDLRQLASDSDFSSGLRQIQSDVSQTATDLAQERSDAANGPGDDCENAADTVYQDAADMIYQSEQDALAQDVNQIVQASAVVSRDEADVEADLTALHSLGKSPPSTVGPGLAAARSAVSQADSQVNAGIDTVAGYVKTAYQIADGMDTGSCSDVTGPGTPPTPPAHL